MEKMPSESSDPPPRRKEGVYYLMGTSSTLGHLAREGALEMARARHAGDLIISPPSSGRFPWSEPEVLGVLQCGFDKNMFDLILSRNYPCVNLSNSFGEIPGMGNLLSDDRAVGVLAARHLLDRGHRTFLAVWYEGRTTHAERAEGFLRTVRDAGAEALELPNSFSARRGVPNTHLRYLSEMRELVSASLGKLPLGSGFFASNDDLALLIQQVMKLSFPGHLDTSGIVGVDNNARESGHFGNLPDLTSVVPAFREMGADAMAWLLDHPGEMGKEAVTGLRRRYAPAGIEVRASTAVGACGDPLTARMIRWIWERVREGQKISVSDLARAHHMARKTLERRFSTHAGCSPGDLITRLRLDLARELLRTTHYGIAEISHRCGFAKQDILSRAIRHTHGCTPSEYRKRVTGME